ncbi:hypothetical protein, partial [Dyadobacter sp. CY312]|uniref:hypothetical protein n=1 Tax=Dyadobacter sp. CY312 TaxID=2907303 RepID=UPI001F28BF33
HWRSVSLVNCLINALMFRHCKDGTISILRNSQTPSKDIIKNLLFASYNGKITMRRKIYNRDTKLFYLFKNTVIIYTNQFDISKNNIRYIFYYLLVSGFRIYKRFNLAK